MNNSIHDITGKSKMESLTNFASQIDDTIFFKKGLYNLNLIFDSKKNITFHFDNSGFNLIHITDDKGEMSSNINLLGTLISYDQFGTYNSKDIKVDSLIIKSDSIKNIRFKNIDVLCCHGHGGVFTIHNGDRAVIEDILYEDIRVEHYFDKFTVLVFGFIKLFHSKISISSIFNGPMKFSIADLIRYNLFFFHKIIKTKVF
jgi:hypothetical protein